MVGNRISYLADGERQRSLGCKFSTVRFYGLALLCRMCCANVKDTDMLEGVSYRREPDMMLFGSSDQMIILSLLDGNILSIDINTGILLWSISEDPIVTMPDTNINRLNFFPNPQDGSIYFYNKIKENLERLPLTIPELVHISPMKSADGLLYTATKSDMWLEIDPRSGRKLHTISSDGTMSSCPATESYTTSVLIARTAYTLRVYDSVTKEKRWDATYLEYNSDSYLTSAYRDHIYFSSTTDDILVSIDQTTGREMWRGSYNSPVMAVFALEEGQLRKLPIYSVAIDSIDLLKGAAALSLYSETNEKTVETNVRKSLFVGVHKKLLYAVDCFADERILRMDFCSFDSTTAPLIEGPPSEPISNDLQVHFAQTGHYLLPQTSEIEYHQAPESMKDFKDFVMTLRRNSDKRFYYKVAYDDFHNNGPFDGDMAFIIIEAVVLIVTGSAVAFIAWFITESKMKSYNNHESSPTTSASGVKISYNVQKVLGHGSHGTIVFKGTFDGREVAVKRILPECFEMADHEVNLLRHSDEHPNVIRYFCMEEDGIFKYIALELCDTNLHEYVEKSDVQNYAQCSESILNQAVRGLAHLHLLGIVHRDIKPRNVLISYSSLGGIRAMISDFGLCRKLPNNRHSFTAMSGIAGTEGWIAPEVFAQDRKVASRDAYGMQTFFQTFAADIFSMGCVMFFVFTRGSHPFGPIVKRQANISAGDYNLNELLKLEMCTAEDLIKKMISNNCNFRPSSTEVLSHCVFWNKGKKLSFFLDVSDRLEKEPVTSPVLQCIESRAKLVVGCDWINKITDDLRTDLKRFRSYHGGSVRELLRALRNKKHHYSELPVSLKRTLGDIPDDFVVYFTSRFPHLLTHVYNEMEIIKHEPIFHNYYDYQ